LIPLSGEPTSKEIESARKKTEALIQKIKKGADFRSVAAAQSSGQQAMKGGDLGWRTLNELPSAFAKQITTLQTNQTSNAIQTPNGFHIIQLLGKKGGPAKLLDESELQIIFLKTNSKAPPEKVRNAANNIKKKLNEDKDFSAIARKYSQDRKSAKQGGYLGWTQPGQLEPVLDKAIGQLNSGDISEPIKTAKGWYIIKVIAKRQSTKATASEKAKVEQAIFQQKLMEGIQTFVTNLRNQAYVKTFV